MSNSRGTMVSMQPRNINKASSGLGAILWHCQRKPQDSQCLLRNITAAPLLQRHDRKEGRELCNDPSDSSQEGLG